MSIEEHVFSTDAYGDVHTSAEVPHFLSSQDGDRIVTISIN